MWAESFLTGFKNDRNFQYFSKSTGVSDNSLQWLQRSTLPPQLRVVLQLWCVTMGFLATNGNTEKTNAETVRTEVIYAASASEPC